MAYFAFDTETTGLTPGYHEILQLGVVLLDNNFEELGSGYARLMPKHWELADADALRINGIEKDKWEPTDKTSRESIDKIIRFVRKHIPFTEKINLLGHNVSGFDEPFLKALFKEEGVDWIFHYHGIDTMEFMKLWYIVTEQKIGSLRLIDCCKEFNITNDSPHDAMADVRASVNLFRAIKQDIQKRIKGQQELF